MITEDCPFSQPQEIYHHTCKQVGILHESNVYTKIAKQSSRKMFHSEQVPAPKAKASWTIPQHINQTLILPVVLPEDEAGLDRHVKYF